MAFRLRVEGTRCRNPTKDESSSDSPGVYGYEPEGKAYPGILILFLLMSMNVAVFGFFLIGSWILIAWPVGAVLVGAYFGWDARRTRRLN